MKLENRLIAIAIFISMALIPVSCRKDPPAPVPETPARETPAEKKTDTPELQFDGETSVLAYIGEPVKVSFKASGEGKSSCRVSFASDSKSSVEGSYDANKGSGYLTVTLNDSAKRSFSVVKATVKGGGKDRTYSVKVTAYYLDIKGKDIVLPGDAGADAKLDYDIDTNVPDFVPAISTDATWLKIEENTVTTTQENASGETRTAKITFSDKDGHFEPVTLKVNQETLAPQPKPGCVDFADWAFKKACLEITDSDKDGEVSMAEAASVQELNLYNKNISDLKGIESFTHIESLNVSRNNLKELILDNPASFSHLRNIEAKEMNLEIINLSGCYAGIEFKFNGGKYYLYEGTEVKYNEPAYYESTDYSFEPIHIIQEHSKGTKGIKIYIETTAFFDVDYLAGAHETLLQKVTNGLFFLEPFKSMREYFDIYHLPCIAPNTKQIGGLNDEQVSLINGHKNSGALCVRIHIHTDTDRTRANATILQNVFENCTYNVNLYLKRMGNVSEGTIIHEMGHAIGGLGDQYEEQGREYTEAPNFTKNPNREQAPWMQFFSLEKYKDRVGFYAKNGGFYPSLYSIMDGGGIIDEIHPYEFDSVSRYEIFKNILIGANLYNTGMTTIPLPNGNWSSWDTTIDASLIWEHFLEYDTINDHLPY